MHENPHILGTHDVVSGCTSLVHSLYKYQKGNRKNRISILVEIEFQLMVNTIKNTSKSILNFLKRMKTSLGIVTAYDKIKF